MRKDLEHYLRLKYPMEIVEDEEGGYFGQIPDLPGCIAQGETVEETVENLNSAKRAWMEVRLEDGLEIPAPHEAVETYSGRFLLRVPKSVHCELARRARREGMSLNSYVLHLLSVAVGREQEAEKAAVAHREVFDWARILWWRENLVRTQSMYKMLTTEPMEEMTLVLDTSLEESEKQRVTIGLPESMARAGFYLPLGGKVRDKVQG